MHSKNVFRTDNQQERFSIQLDPNYVVGLADGEGYFSVYARYGRQKNWILHDVKLTFGVKLRAEDGRTILTALQSFFGCGSVYFRQDRRENFSDCYEFQVRTHRDIFGKIIPFFRDHPLQFPTKRKTFERFCQIAGIVQKREHLLDGGIDRVKLLAKALH